MVQQFIASRTPALDWPRATQWHHRNTTACAARSGRSRVDELVMMRAARSGDLYVHQDANWNVIALTDLGGSVVERSTYTPYGELTVHQVTGYGDRDGDGTVDATDKGTPGATCTGTVSGACRILDLDFDGDYDSADATIFDSLPQGLGRHPGRTATGVRQPFGHQGLVWDGEVRSYQNRNRQFGQSIARFLQRDHLAIRPVALSGYQDGMGLYDYERGAPGTNSDPLGLAICATGSADDWICCDGINWGLGISQSGAKSFCCGPLALAGSNRCKKHACLNPNIEQLVPNIAIRNCIISHECEHISRMTCKFVKTKTSCACGSYFQGNTLEQEECLAYTNELACTQLVPGSDADLRCNFVGCMRQRLCDRGQKYKAALDACHAEGANNYEGRGGCAQPDHPNPP